jgi:hypothetical protein
VNIALFVFISILCHCEAFFAEAICCYQTGDCHAAESSSAARNDMNKEYLHDEKENHHPFFACCGVARGSGWLCWLCHHKGTASRGNPRYCPRNHL